MVRQKSHHPLLREAFPEPPNAVHGPSVALVEADSDGVQFQRQTTGTDIRTGEGIKAEALSRYNKRFGLGILRR